MILSNARYREWGGQGLSCSHGGCKSCSVWCLQFIIKTSCFYNYKCKIIKGVNYKRDGEWLEQGRLLSDSSKVSRVLGKVLGLWLFWEAKWKAKERGAEKRCFWHVECASGQSEAWGQEIMWPAINGAFEEWSESRLCLNQIGVMMFGVREKSLSFGEETDPWMTPQVVFSPPVQHQRPWQDFVWSRTCLAHAHSPGKQKIRLVGVLPSLLSPEVDRLLLDSLAKGTSSGSVHFYRLNVVVVWWFKKMEPTNQNNPLSQPHFPSCLLTRETIFCSLCFWKRLQVISSCKSSPSLISKRFRNLNYRPDVCFLLWRKKKLLLRSVSRYLSHK